MRTLQSSLVGLAMFALANVALAVPVTLPFTIEVKTASAVVEGVAVGSRYSGSIRYDTDDLVPNGDNFQTLHYFVLDFSFSRAEKFAAPELQVNNVVVSPTGELLDLDFSFDIGNDLFFSAANLAFNYEFSKEGPEDEGNGLPVTLAMGRGVVLRDVVQVSEPATALLLLPVMAMLARRRRRQHQ